MGNQTTVKPHWLIQAEVELLEGLNWNRKYVIEL